MLTIGVIRKDAWAKMFGIYTQQLIKDKIAIDAVIVYFDSEKDLINALYAGEVAVVPRPMRELSTTLPNGIVITAVSERQVTSQSLIIPKKNSDVNQLLSLKPHAKVSVQNDISRLQFLEFRADILAETRDLTPVQSIEKLNQDDFDGCVIPSISVRVMALSSDDYTIIPFSPKELITEPGHGITAFLTAADDLTTRRQLKVLHTPSVSALSNVERRLKQLFNDADIAAYCENDKAHNYHLWAAAIINNELKKTRISQSTHFELAERCFEKLHQ
jgi:hydroxymethylbilane synthase